MPVISKNIPYNLESKEGIFQYMLNNDNFSRINVEYPSLDDQTSVYNIFGINDSYYCSMTNQTKNSNYILIEFTDRFVFPTWYIIRSSYSNIKYLKSWVLEGSLTGKEWVELHSMYNSTQLNRYAYKGYKLLNNGPFRFFKLVQTGPNDGETLNEIYRFRVSYLELFGYISNGMIQSFLCNKKYYISLFIINILMI